MEPRTASSSPSPEMGAYRAPEAQTSPRVEESLSNAPEQAPVSPESHTVPRPAPAPTNVKALPQLPTLPALQTSAASSSASPVKDSNPLAASDEDVIEKEWVDKAKKIVALTKDDPYAQEKEVSRLQADYLKKRYGKEIKLKSE